LNVENTDEELQTVSIVPTPVIPPHLTKTPTAAIAKAILAPYPSDPPTPPGTYTARDFLNRQKVVLDTGLTERALVDALTMMFAAEEPHGVGSIIPDQTTLDDLVLVAGNKSAPNSSVLRCIDQTRTLAGRIFTAFRLARPTDALSLIEKRQQLLKTLTDPAGREPVQNLALFLKTIGENEKHLLSFWTRQRQLLPGRADKYFSRVREWIDSKINQSRHLLTANASLEVLKTALSTMTVAMAVIGMPLYALSLTGALGDGKASSLLEQYNARFSGSSGPLYLLASLLPSSAARALGSLIGWTIASLTVKTIYEWNRVELEFDQLTHEKMFSVAKAYRNMRQVYELVKPSPLKDQLEEFHKLEIFFKNPKLKELFAALDSATFNGEAATPLFQRGNVLYPWRQFEDKEVQKAFGEAIHAIGEIDSALGASALLSDRGYCLPRFATEESHPVISARNYWNPMVGVDKTVFNSMDLGARFGIPNAIVTGSNGGGKSTNLRALALLVVMAQSLGIAAAEEMTLTPFSRLQTSMSSTDSIGDGQSLFKAQAHFASQTIQKVRNFDRFSFLVLDELFNGTNPTEGPAFAKAVAKVLGEFRRSILIYATHFQEVPDLADESDRFSNFCVSRDVEGKYTYTLEPGVSRLLEAVAAARDIAFDEETLEFAEAYKRLKLAN
jgi:hypothetical protein